MLMMVVQVVVNWRSTTRVVLQLSPGLISRIVWCMTDFSVFVSNQSEFFPVSIDSLVHDRFCNSIVLVVNQLFKHGHLLLN
jgi:hypothetical protein